MNSTAAPDVRVPPPLQFLDEDFDSVLAVVAHPDDLEYGSAAAVARWTAQGKRVAYRLVSSGEAGIDGMEPEVAGPLREKEQLAAAAVVGVSDVGFLGHRDGVIEYGLPLRRDVAAAIRQHRPDVVLTGNFHPTWPHGAPNQADHIAVGRAVLDAVRDAANRWVFRELLEQGHEPWTGVRTLLVAGSPAASHGVDVTEHFSQGLTSLQTHSAYLAALGPGPLSDPEEFLEAMGRATGARLGCRFGVAFEAVAFG